MVCCKIRFGQYLILRSSSSWSPANVSKILKNTDKNWSSVLDAGSRLNFMNKHIHQFFSPVISEEQQDAIFLDSFLERFPFVQKLLTQSLSLNHPIKQVSLPILKSASVSSCSGSSHLCVSNFLILPVALLFLSKICQNSKSVVQNPDQLEEKQLVLAKASMMLHLSQRIHKSVKNSDEKMDEVGNKIAVLVGDLFITQMYSLLAQLNHNQIVKCMSDTMAQFSSQNFPHTNSSSSKCTETTQPLSAAIKILFANSFSCTGMLISNWYSLEDLSQDFQIRMMNHNFLQLGYLVGNLYHVHESTLLLLQSLLGQAECGEIGEVSKYRKYEIDEQLSGQMDKLQVLRETILKLLTKIEGDKSGMKEFVVLLNYLSLQGIS